MIGASVLCAGIYDYIINNNTPVFAPIQSLLNTFTAESLSDDLWNNPRFPKINRSILFLCITRWTDPAPRNRNCKYKPGDLIPTEAELQARFDVSRATIRQAIADLVYSGLVERKRSQGTRVASGRFEATLQELASFTNEMMSSNLNLTTHILQFLYIQPPEPAQEAMDLRADEMVAMMERARFVDDRPIAVERWYAPLKYFPGISKDMFKPSGMEQSTYYMMMKRYNIQVTRTVDSVFAVGLQPHEARILKVEQGYPALLRSRISYDANDIPVNYASGVYLINLKFIMSTNKMVIHNANAYKEIERN